MTERYTPDPERQQEAEIPEALQRFFSSDPRKVLGVADDATEADIHKAWRQLQLRFHPDVYHHPQAIEIAQNINAAFVRLTRGTPEQQNHEREHDPMRRMAEMLSALYNGPDFFRGWVASAQAASMSQQERVAILGSDKAQEILQMRCEIHLEQSRGLPGAWVQYVAQWKEAGIDVASYIHRPEVRHTILTIAAREGPGAYTQRVDAWKKLGVEFPDLRQAKKSPEMLEVLKEKLLEEIAESVTPEEVLEYVAAWKQAGIRLDSMVHSPEAKRLLEDRAIEALEEEIGMGSEEGAGTGEYGTLIRFWKKAGVDLTAVINYPKAQQLLKEGARFELMFGTKALRKFVDKWRSAGWQLHQEILKMIKSA